MHMPCHLRPEKKDVCAPVSELGRRGAGESELVEPGMAVEVLSDGQLLIETGVA
jgi:hypothetical protein